MFTWEKSYFPRATPGGNVTISWVSKSSYLPYAREMNVVFPQAYVLVNSAKLNILAVFAYKIIISEHLLSYLYSAKSWEFRIRKIRYCWEGNMILLRGKYDVLINVTWDCFDQSNFYISRINIIVEYNTLFPARWSSHPFAWNICLTYGRNQVYYSPLGLDVNTLSCIDI